MNNMTMSSANATIMTISFLQFIMGETLNVGILMASFENLKGGHNVAELIYFFMGLANVFIQAALTVLNLFYIHWSHLFKKREVFLSLFTLFSGLMHYSFWLTAWLCVHYCIRIANFNLRVFRWLNRVLSSFRLHVCIMSVMPFVLSLLPVWFVSAALRVQCPGQCTLVATFKAIHLLNPSYTAVNLLVGGILPFGLAFISAGITASSLIRHMRKMKQNLSGSSPANPKTVRNATKTMILFLTLSVTLYVSEILLFSMTASNASQILEMTSWLVIMSFPTVEAAIIIQASSKIKRQFLGRFCFWKSRRRINKT